MSDEANTIQFLHIHEVIQSLVDSMCHRRKS